MKQIGLTLLCQRLCVHTTSSTVAEGLQPVRSHAVKELQVLNRDVRLEATGVEQFGTAVRAERSR